MSILIQAALHDRLIASRSDLARGVHEELGRDLERLQYSRSEQLAVRLSLEEALVNAMKHGNGFNPERLVRITWRIDAREALILVEDEGVGFIPTDVPDPTRPENLSRPSGRGLLMMRHFMDDVRHEGRGNVVVMRKQRRMVLAHSA